MDGGAPVTSQPAPGQGPSNSNISIAMPAPNPTNPFAAAAPNEQTSLNMSEQQTYTPGNYPSIILIDSYFQTRCHKLSTHLEWMRCERNALHFMWHQWHSCEILHAINQQFVCVISFMSRRKFESENKRLIHFLFQLFLFSIVLLCNPLNPPIIKSLLNKKWQTYQWAQPFAAHCSSILKPKTHNWFVDFHLYRMNEMWNVYRIGILSPGW